MAGDRLEVGFENAILATGSVASRLPIPGAELPSVFDPQGLIEIGFVPESLTLIGDSPNGVEMAQVFTMLGARVTLLEAIPRIFGPVDGVPARLLAEKLKADGIGEETRVTVEPIEGAECWHVRATGNRRRDLRPAKPLLS